MEPGLVTKVVNYKELLTTVNWAWNLWLLDFWPAARSCEKNSAPQEYSEWPFTRDVSRQDRCSGAMCCLWHVVALTALHLPGRWRDLEKRGLLQVLGLMPVVDRSLKEQLSPFYQLISSTYFSLTLYCCRKWKGAGLSPFSPIAKPF